MNTILPLVSLMLRASLTSFGRFMVPLVKLASAMIPINPTKAIKLDLRIASINTIKSINIGYG